MATVSSSMQRQVSGYPNWKYYKLIIALAAKEEMGKSEILNFIIEKFFNERYSEKQITDMLSLYDKMPADCRKKPSTYMDKNDLKESRKK